MPKNESVEDTQTVALSAELLKDIIAGAVTEAVKAVGTQNTAQDLADVVAKATAEAARALAPESYKMKRGEEKSVYNPLGERDHPRPDVQGEVFWAGARLSKDQLTVDEIAMVNQLEPGEYWFTGNDDGRMLLRVINLEPAGSKQRRLNVILPGLSDPNTRVNYPSMKRILSEVLAVPA